MIERIVSILRGLCWCLVPLWIVFFMPRQIGGLVRSEASGIRQAADAAIIREGAATRAMVGGQIAAAIVVASATEKDANMRVAAITHLAGAVGDKLLDENNGILAIANQARKDTDAQLGMLNGTVAAALNGEDGIVPSFRSLTGAYAELPNRFYSSPELASLRPEITCRDANGNGYGGSSTTQFTLSTALPAAVGANQLANRGDGTGFYIRVIQQGTTGLIGEQPIVSNTVGTTPVITVAGSLGFTPAAGDKYEILSGRVFLMATAASMWKWYDVATNSFSAALTTTNLTIPAIDNEIIVLDEQYTPLGNLPSTGFFGNLTATGATNITNTTLTGTSAGADANLQANEYANFQVRIISDGTNPTAVGQRKKITSHTAANPTVYTLSGVWGVAPSNTAQYVIEGVGDIICMTGSASALAHTYAAGGFRAHSISADPLFTNAGGITAADYKWPLTSPLLGAGATIGSFSTDYFGTARPQGAAWDIGIYEAISSALKLAIGFPGSFWSAFP